MKVAIVGGTGLIGSALHRALVAAGDDVIVLTRGKLHAPHLLGWDATRGPASKEPLEGLDLVVNLAGAPIADRPWTSARRKVLVESRIDATDVLIASLASLSAPPKAYLGAGLLGLFGDRGDELLNDDSEPGSGFLADLAQAWEASHQRAAASFGARTAVLRMQIVLGKEGGAFPRIVTPFRYGMGGWLGNGRQYTSWVSLHDCVRAFEFVGRDGALAGSFNVTTPEPMLNKEWCRALGRALSRPVLTHAPKWALRGALGAMADDVFLSSVRAVPRRLSEAGFAFEDTDLEATCRALANAD